MNDTKETGNKELDLLEVIVKVFNTIAGWFISLAKGLLISLVFLIRNWLPLLISIIVGTGISYALKKTLPPVYSTELTSKSNTIPIADMISYINRLHSFCQTKNIGVLSQSLSLNPDVAAKITDIQAFWMIDLTKDNSPDYVDYDNTFNVYDTLNRRMPDRFVVRLRFNSIENLSSIRDGLFSYLNNNQIFAQQNQTRLRQLDELILRYNYDIKQLDSLQKIKYYEETKNLTAGKTGQMVFLQEQKTQLVYDDIYKLYQQKQILEMQKEVNPGIITVLSDFTVPVRPISGTIYYGKYVVPAFFLITLLILIVASNFKRMREFLMKS